MNGPESFPTHSPENENADVEKEANYEGNDSLLLFERLRNPIIREQLIQLFQSAYEARAADPKPDRKVVIDPETKKPLRNEQGKVVFGTVPFVMPTREEIERQIDDSIAHVESVTGVSFEGREPSQNTIDLNWRLPLGEKPTTKQYAIIEAHEKGHAVRGYPSFGKINPIRERFMLAFDPHAVVYTQEDFEREFSASERKKTSFEDAKEDFFHYLFSTGELAERMSQLKNYFGMKGAEQFTKAHLDYARRHYITDTNFDNRMTQFFQAITPEKEDAFIELINTVGI